MADFAQYLREDMRLVLLRILNELPEYRANSSVLTTALDRLGHAATRDQVRTELAWLQEQSLVTTEDVGPVVVAALTERGSDVARGRARVPGIKRPGA